MNEPIFTVCDRCEQIHDAEGDVYECVAALKRELMLVRGWLVDAKKVVRDRDTYIDILEEDAPRVRRVQGVEVQGRLL